MQYASQDSNKMYRDEQGRLISERSAFIADKEDMKGLIEYHKSRGDTFETKFSKATQSLVLLKKQIKVTGSAKPKTIVRDTTIYLDNVRIDTPSFDLDTGDTDHRIRIVGNKNQIAYSLSITDKTELKTDDLGKKGTKVTVLNHNRYVESSEAISLIVAPKKVPFWKKLKYALIGGSVVLILKGL